MIPDNVEKIIMTKEDYDRNVEQMLLEKIELQQRIEKAIKYIEKNIPFWEEWHYDMCIDTEDMKKIINILRGE